MSDPIDTVRNFYEAITAGDVSARTSLMAPDIEWITVMDFHITGKGPEEVWDIKDGKIARFRQYIDTVAIEEAPSLALRSSRRPEHCLEDTKDNNLNEDNQRR